MSFQSARTKAENKLPKQYSTFENIPQISPQKIGRRAGKHANGLATEHLNYRRDLLSAQNEAFYQKAAREQGLASGVALPYGRASHTSRQWLIA